MHSLRCNNYSHEWVNNPSSAIKHAIAIRNYNTSFYHRLFEFSAVPSAFASSCIYFYFCFYFYFYAVHSMRLRVSDTNIYSTLYGIIDANVKILVCIHK